MKGYILADIGGTHSTFSLVEIEGKEIKELHRHIFQTQEYNDFIVLISEFINQIKNYQINELNAVIAAAGPHKKNQIVLNINKVKIDKLEIENKTQIKQVDLMNDFSAISYSTFNLDKNEIINLNKGTPYGEKELVIGAGTGLGVSIVDKKKIIENEEGHNELRMETDFDIELLQFIRKKIKRDKIDYGDLISGSGIERIYNFLCEEQLSAKEISKQKNSNENAKKTFEIFYSYYARFLRIMTLEHMTQKAIYLAGGIIEKNLDFSYEDFMKEFTNSENHKEFLSRIPIYIIKNYDTSILGLENYLRLKESL